jgi:hypothetical protein
MADWLCSFFNELARSRALQVSLDRYVYVTMIQLTSANWWGSWVKRRNHCIGRQAAMACH